MQVAIIPTLQDNYSFIISLQGKAIVIDLGEAKPVLDYLSSANLKLEAILITHHHYDHTDGVKELASTSLANIPVFATTHKPFYTNWQNIKSCPSLKLDFLQDDKNIIPITVYKAPGHTDDHVMFHIQDALFVGDVLFGAGAGKHFEGTEQAFAKTYFNFEQFNNDTQIYFGHEYTKTNLQFAIELDPKNEATNHRYKHLSVPSTPSSLKLERATNPFLRGRDLALQEIVKTKLGVEKFEEQLMPYYVRKLKDKWDQEN